jgi:hypothetical protein
MGKKKKAKEEKTKHKKKNKLKKENTQAEEGSFEGDMKAMLKGKHCDGCHNHCKLSKPKCSKGRKARDKILAGV